jgi:hypothetical protein
MWPVYIGKSRKTISDFVISAYFLYLWTFCARRLYSCLVAREKITITFVERFICLLLVSNLNLLSKFLLFTNSTSYTGCGTTHAPEETDLRRQQ